MTPFQQCSINDTRIIESKSREDNAPLVREKWLVSQSTHYQGNKVIQRYITMRIQKIALQDEYLALDNCTTGEQRRYIFGVSELHSR